MNRGVLASAIEAQLRSADSPLKARHIASALCKAGMDASTSEINKVLYSGQFGNKFDRHVEKDESVRWTLRNQRHTQPKRSPSPKVEPRLFPETPKAVVRPYSESEVTITETVEASNDFGVGVNLAVPPAQDVTVTLLELQPSSNHPDQVTRTLTLEGQDITITEHPAVAPIPGDPSPSSPPFSDSTPDPSIMRFAEGDRLIDRYEVLRLLGEGGMGQVLLVHDQEVGVERAVKTVNKRTQAQLTALQNEAGLLMNVDNPAFFPRVYQSFENDGVFFFPMDFLEGEDLRKRLNGMTPEEVGGSFVRSTFEQVCQRLQYLHNFPRGQILFRDLKPSNIMLGARGEVRLIDFGIASMAEQRGMHAGTAFFWAPEARDGHYSVQSDIFALGGLLLCLLRASGSAPRPGERVHVIAPGNRGLAKPLLKLARSMRAEKRGDRPATVGDVLDRFRDCFQKRSSEAGEGTYDNCPVCGTIQDREYFLCWECGQPLKALPVNSEGGHPSPDRVADIAHRVQVAYANSVEVTRARATLALRAAALKRLPAYEELTCLPYINVAPYPYQAGAALRVLREFMGRGILADEVGLGKTIEAGLIVKECLVRGEARRVLVVVPPQVREQWREEMQSKFNINDVHIFGRDDGMIDDRRVFARPSVFVITSHQQTWHTGDTMAAHEWDVVIIDEAHRARPHTGKTRGTKLGAFVASLRTRRLLLLSATPAQNDLGELYGIVTLLRPGLFNLDRKTFLRRYGGVRGNREVINAAELRNELESVMVRNRRGAVHKAFPSRQAQTFKVRLSPSHKEAYRRLISVLQQSDQAGLALTTRAQQFCTSFSALAASKVAGEVGRIAEELAQDPHFKLEVFFDKIIPTLDTQKEQKILIFSRFVESQREIHRMLISAGYRAVWAGGTQSQKTNALSDFRSDGGSRFLVTGASLSEGINLQFCRCMVNFDLPWNPQQVEQRIGRIQRLGSKFREVFVINLMAKDTVEELVIEYLEEKLRMFESVFGFVEAVLGRFGENESVEGFVRDALRRGRAGEIDPSSARAGAEKIDKARKEAESDVSSGHFDSLLEGLGSDEDLDL
jgi:superfamily II DNA or RNA helicase/predicted Ser/Thr protein kinase